MSKGYTLVGTTNYNFKELCHEYYTTPSEVIQTECDKLIQGIEACSRAGKLAEFKRNWFYPLFGGKKYKVIVKK